MLKNKLTKKTGVAFFILLVLWGPFFNAGTAHAVAPLAAAALPLLGQIFDTVNKFSQGWLDALDFVDNSVMTILVWLAFITALSAGFLLFSAAFIDWASSQPIDLTSANTLVHQGWNFTVGLVDMLLIIILIVIALSYIFKSETWGMKKALPKLILVALLLNFSLLFVQMFNDLAWVVQKSFVNSFLENGKMAQTMVEPLKIKLAEALGKQTADLTGYVWVSAIPIKGALKLIKFLPLIAGEAFLGTYSQTILLIIFSITGGFIFLVYGFLFLIRIAVVWLLAILAPLAFAALILPKTEKFFGEWVKALFQWLFFGIVAFFFMGLGIKLYAVVAPAKLFTFDFGEASWGIIEGYSKLIFLLIYLGVVLVLTKKLIPKGTEMVWSTFAKASTAAGVVGAIATLRGAGKVVTEGFVRPTGTYQWLREGGMGRRQAFTETMRRGLLGARQQVWPKRPMAAKERIARVAKAIGLTGTLKAFGDAAKAGAMAGLDIKFKKRGLRKKPCESCGFGSAPNEKIAASADRCPRCRYSFI